MRLLGRCLLRSSTLVLTLIIVTLPINVLPLWAADAGPAPVILDAEAFDLGDALASVNGVLIEGEHFQRSFERIAAYSSAADSQTLAFDVLNTMIEQELIIQFATGYELDIEDAPAEVERLRASLSDSDWEAWLTKNLYTEAEFAVAMREQMTNAAVRDHVTAYLEGSVEHVHARHILLASERQALSVLNRLAAGESFAGLAAALSGDVSTRDRGGDLGWFIDGELLDDNLSAEAFLLYVGSTGGPIATRLGYHVLQILGKEPRSIETERIPYIAERIFERWLREQVEAAEIILNNEALRESGGASP